MLIHHPSTLFFLPTLPVFFLSLCLSIPPPPPPSHPSLPHLPSLPPSHPLGCLVPSGVTVISPDMMAVREGRREKGVGGWAGLGRETFTFTMGVLVLHTPHTAHTQLMWQQQVTEVIETQQLQRKDSWQTSRQLTISQSTHRNKGRQTGQRDKWRAKEFPQKCNLQLDKRWFLKQTDT